jgi:hypothetical protein
VFSILGIEGFKDSLSFLHIVIVYQQQ